MAYESDYSPRLVTESDISGTYDVGDIVSFFLEDKEVKGKIVRVHRYVDKEGYSDPRGSLSDIYHVLTSHGRYEVKGRYLSLLHKEK